MDVAKKLHNYKKCRQWWFSAPFYKNWDVFVIESYPVEVTDRGEQELASLVLVWPSWADDKSFEKD